MPEKIPALLSECLAAPNHEAQNLAEDILLRNGYSPILGRKYTYGEGTIPVLLVAHTDTVHRKPPEHLFVDTAAQVVWSPNGLGADDRAGVYGIAHLLERGFRPHVLFTDEEETGGHGAQAAALELAAPEVRLMIQLDRRGATDAVFYSCDNPSLTRWVEKRGFKEAGGSFTDISILMPEWGIAGVNLSVGYYREHTTSEYLRLDELAATLDKVAGMLRRPPKRRFDYTSEKWAEADSLPFWADRDSARAESACPWKARPNESWDEEYRRLLAKDDQADDWRDWTRWDDDVGAWVGK